LVNYKKLVAPKVVLKYDRNLLNMNVVEISGSCEAVLTCVVSAGTERKVLPHRDCLEAQ